MIRQKFSKAKNLAPSSSRIFQALTLKAPDWRGGLEDHHLRTSRHWLHVPLWVRNIWWTLKHILQNEAKKIIRLVIQKVPLTLHSKKVNNTCQRPWTRQECWWRHQTSHCSKRPKCSRWIGNETNKIKHLWSMIINSSVNDLLFTSGTRFAVFKLPVTKSEWAQLKRNYNAAHAATATVKYSTYSP